MHRLSPAQAAPETDERGACVCGELHVGFLVAVTTFSTPQQVTLDELRIESCFPLDDATREVCKRLARDAS